MGDGARLLRWPNVLVSDWGVEVQWDGTLVPKQKKKTDLPECMLLRFAGEFNAKDNVQDLNRLLKTRKRELVNSAALRKWCHVTHQTVWTSMKRKEHLFLQHFMSSLSAEMEKVHAMEALAVVIKYLDVSIAKRSSNSAHIWLIFHFVVMFLLSADGWWEQFPPVHTEQLWLESVHEAGCCCGQGTQPPTES